MSSLHFLPWPSQLRLLLVISTITTTIITTTTITICITDEIGPLIGAFFHRSPVWQQPMVVRKH
jgi:hypothetical protein